VDRDGSWPSLAGRRVRDAETGGSNPPDPTTPGHNDAPPLCRVRTSESRGEVLARMPDGTLSRVLAGAFQATLAQLE
jgi:hypothetical protein